MNKRTIKENIYWLGVVDWERRLFDSLIPLPDGTTYNAYLVEGSEKTVLLDTVDPPTADELMAQLADVKKVDYIVSQHAEQDHSGAIPRVLERFPEAKVVVTPKAKGMLIDHLQLPEESFVTVEDGETLSLGNKTLKFIYTPWVHWPETMVSYLEEDKILFSCDFYGSHIATSDLYVTDQGRVYEAAKRYFAEIMMPFRTVIEKNIEKLKAYDIQMIAPSHGQIYDKPGWIMDAYKEWVTGDPHNLVVLPYISMHGSTRKLVDHLLSRLVDKGGPGRALRSCCYRYRQTCNGTGRRGNHCGRRADGPRGSPSYDSLRDPAGQRAAAQGQVPLYYRILWMGRQDSGDPRRSDSQLKGRSAGSCLM